MLVLVKGAGTEVGGMPVTQVTRLYSSVYPGQGLTVSFFRGNVTRRVCKKEMRATDRRTDGRTHISHL